jgi:chaperonin GroEL
MAFVLDFLNNRSISISSIEDIHNIALLSSNGDEQIAKLISTSLEKIGIGGTISIVESNTNETKVELVEGFRIGAGYFTHEFVNDKKRQMVRYDNTKIIVIDGELAAEPKDMLPVLEKVYRAQSSLVVIAENFSKDMKAMFIGNAVRGKMMVCLVQAPMYGKERKELLQDIALITGAKLINPLKHKMDDVKLEHLGSCRRFQASHNETVIMDGTADYELLEEHVGWLNEQLDEMEIGPEAEKVNARIERLSSGVALIKVGGFSEMEVAERKFRVEDALEAVRAALVKGTVPGGCVTWLDALGLLEGDQIDLSRTIGYSIFKEVLLSPLKTLCKNSGVAFGCVRDKMIPDENIGFNFRTKKYVHMIEDGLIEPVKVLESALLNSFSLFETLIKSGGAIFRELENE